MFINYTSICNVEIWAEIMNMFWFLWTILIYKLSDPLQYEKQEMTKTRSFISLPIIRLYWFWIMRNFPISIYYSFMFGNGMTKNELLLMFIEFNIVFFTIHMISIEILTYIYSNVYVRSWLLFEFGNLYSSGFITAWNGSYIANNGKIYVLLLHILFISTTFVGPDRIEAFLIKVDYDYLFAKINYTVYVLSILIVLFGDKLLDPLMKIETAHEYKYMDIPNFEENPINYLKYLIIYYGFGIYMYVIAVTYEPITVEVFV